MDNRKISLCITTFNEYEKLLESFRQVMFDSRIGEILILDDKSDEEIYYRIEQWYEYDSPEGKVKLAQNTRHIGEKLSQHTAIVLADNDYAFCSTSNSIITKEIIDEIFRNEWGEQMHLSFGKSGLFLNRGEYLRTFKPESE